MTRLFNDELVVDGVAPNLEIIGEAARQLPEEYKCAHTEIPWTQIAGLRKRRLWSGFRNHDRSSSHDLPQLETLFRPLTMRFVTRLPLNGQADLGMAPPLAKLDQFIVLGESERRSKSRPAVCRFASTGRCCDL